jgi:periplasmic divalent cation tolerance protein
MNLLNVNSKSVKLIMGYVSLPNSEIAKKIAQILINQKYAACVKILNGINSFYMWERAIQDDNEVYLLIKTRESKVESIKAVLDKEHPYKVYEFLYHEVISANEKYTEWVDSSLAEESGSKI